jgi:hypothetical protein
MELVGTGESWLNGLLDYKEDGQGNGDMEFLFAILKLLYCNATWESLTTAAGLLISSKH